jgi:hypothetical protein
MAWRNLRDELAEKLNGPPTGPGAVLLVSDGVESQPNLTFTLE